ncbi:hypothetical protein Desti_4817 [Desulfomonile tiedjei DSM 6799]|uniref:Uncharacterized protein n=1 Tax=Desulfomonile tiedjei (strain ATCC 49306 / DSM 6799 / DCB-1) TaxID=706587 RepID=I4CCZ2_DESTA|nr:hypothetical protein Desti_4817 [Desulfomonile tiedjei DSM 6799]
MIGCDFVTIRNQRRKTRETFFANGLSRGSRSMRISKGAPWKVSQKSKFTLDRGTKFSSSFRPDCRGGPERPPKSGQTHWSAPTRMENRATILCLFMNFETLSLWVPGSGRPPCRSFRERQASRVFAGPLQRLRSQYPDHICQLMKAMLSIRT